MKSEHVNKKVTTRKRELTATIHNKRLMKQYVSELARGGPYTTFYSTDEETMSDTESDSDSDSGYDSDDNRLVIDIENHKKVIENVKKVISMSISELSTIHAVNLIKQTPETNTDQIPGIKTNTDQVPGIKTNTSQTPDIKNEPSQTPGNK